MKCIFGALGSLVLCAWAAAQDPQVRPSITGIAYVRIAVSDLSKTRAVSTQRISDSDRTLAAATP